MTGDGATLFILIGPPGSGKTNLRAKLIDRFSMYNEYANKRDKPACNLTYVSSDEKRQQKRDAHVIWDNDTLFNEIRHDILEGLKKPKSIVIYDATNCSQHYRKNLIAFVRKHIDKVTIYGIVFTTSLRQCFKNLDSTESPDKTKVSDDLIISMYNKLRENPPSCFEGFDVIGTDREAYKEYQNLRWSL